MHPVFHHIATSCLQWHYQIPYFYQRKFFLSEYYVAKHLAKTRTAFNTSWKKGGSTKGKKNIEMCCVMCC